MYVLLKYLNSLIRIFFFGASRVPGRGTYFDRLYDHHRLKEGQNECGQPGGTLVSAPLEAVEQREEASERHGQEHQDPRDDHHPPRQRSRFLPLLTLLFFRHSVTHLRLHNDGLGECG